LAGEQEWGIHSDMEIQFNNLISARLLICFNPELTEPEMEITKNKNPYGFVFENHKHLAIVSRLFGSQIFFLRFLKSIGWYGFSLGFLVVLNLVHQCFV
jgi:hypothetical protein